VNLRRALHRARQGVSLNVDEAATLLHARGDDLVALCDGTGRVRDRGLEAAGLPGVITYSPKVFIPRTGLCRDRCHYRSFATAPNRLATPFLTHERRQPIDCSDRATPRPLQLVAVNTQERP
jgi:FO synthase